MLSPDDRLLYEGSLKRKRDELSAAYTARQEGREEGREEERPTIARAMLAEGVERALIMRFTGLSEAELKELHYSSLHLSCLSGGHMDFGITLKLDMTPERAVALTKQAEAAGFTYGWVFDSHVLWLEPYPVMALMASNTQRMKLGTCVTNPAVRDPTVTASTLATLNLISGGRMVLGIGRGDSSRRVLGKKPTTLASMEQSIKDIKALATGGTVDYEGQPAQMPWVDTSADLPVWVAAYGPKALALAGRVADGVILQFADPHLIKWSLQFVHQGAKEVGRNPDDIQVMSAAPVWVSDDLATAREHVRWFPALVSNHVMDLISRYDPAELPPELTAYVQHREGYNYLHHAEVGSSNATFVSDEVTDRFCIVGPIEEHKRRLQELKDIGVAQFNIYLMSGDEEATLDVYGREIVPGF